MIISKAKIFVTADGKKAVPFESEDAAYLLVGENGEISDAALDAVEGARELAEGKGSGDGGDDLDGLKLGDLKNVADKEEVELPEASRKADVIAAIRAKRKAAK